MDLLAQIENLPIDAKKIYIATYNSAFDQYNDESIASPIALAEIKKTFKNEGGSWMAKELNEINDFGMYCDFQKMDEEQRMVYGYATNDVIDSQGEITELDATSRAIEDYSKWRNIREMHQPKVAGTAPVLEMRKKGLWIGAHIDDDSAWKKCKSGAYKGFSIGGKKLKVVQEFNQSLNKTINRIKDYMLTEISLVDRPANPTATFSFIKRDFDSNEVNKMDNPVEIPKEESKPEVVTPEPEPTVLKPVETPVPAEAEKAPVETEVAKAETVKVEPEVEQVTIAKAEYDALVKQAELVKKQEDMLDLLKAKIEKAFSAEEPKELVQKQDKVVPKSIGELSVMKGGLFSKD